MRIFREEVFGPVVTVTPFDGEAEAIALANDTSTGSPPGSGRATSSRAVRAARAIRAGTVWVNAYGSIRPEVPFGGFGAVGPRARARCATRCAAYRETKAVFIAS